MNNFTSIDSPLYIASLGESGFPFQGRAAIEKLKLICKGLVYVGDEVHVLNRKGVFNPNEPLNEPATGVYEGIHYSYVGGSLYRPKDPISRNLMKLKGSFREYTYLRNLKRQGKLDVALVSTMRFTALLYYFILSRLLGFKLLYSYVELNTAMSSRQKFSQRLNDSLLRKYEFSLVDAVFPISELLIQEVKRRAPKKPYVKVPIICDFESFQIEKAPVEKPYFLYCGSLDYYEVLEFNLKAFESLEDRSYELHLITHGKPAQKETLKQRLEASPKRDLIHVFSGIPFDELIFRYVHASGLLIPLRPTVQDAARFPHKIGEYLASGNPIVTTNYGEVSHYFEDKVHALVADSYELQDFAHKMAFIIQNPEEARQIGLRGQELGWETFDYKAHGNAFHEFINQLVRDLPEPVLSK